MDGYGHDDFPESPLRKGNAVLIQTVTHYWTGRVIQVGAHEIVLAEAAWIPDVGRFHDTLRTGQPAEVEPVPDGIVSIPRAVTTAVLRWSNDLPRSQK